MVHATNSLSCGLVQNHDTAQWIDEIVNPQLLQRILPVRSAAEAE
jgi:hypothetical protein